MMSDHCCFVGVNYIGNDFGREIFMHTSIAALLLLALSSGFLQQNGPQSGKEKALSEIRKERRLRRSENVLEKAQIANGSLWYVDDNASEYFAALNQASLDGVGVKRYHLPRHLVRKDSCPRWKIQNSAFYLDSTGVYEPGPYYAHEIVKIDLKDMVEIPKKADDPEFKGWLDIPRAETVSLKPLAKILMLIGDSNNLRGGEPVYYDFVTDDSGSGKLVVTADGYLSIWEYRFSNDAKEQDESWKRTAYLRAPFNGRFEALLDNGELELITDTGEIWRADEQNNFQKVKAAVIAPTKNSSIVIIEDTDNQAIWLVQIPDEGGADFHLYAVKGGSDSPSDSIRAATQKLVERNH
jgi:hypothetical protein